MAILLPPSGGLLFHFGRRLLVLTRYHNRATTTTISFGGEKRRPSIFGVFCLQFRRNYSSITADDKTDRKIRPTGRRTTTTILPRSRSADDQLPPYEEYHSRVFRIGFELIENYNTTISRDSSLHKSEIALLLRLPHSAHVLDRKRQFVRVLGAWWSLIKPALSPSFSSDRDQLVKIPSLLIHLGKLQDDFPKVRIAEKLDRSGGWLDYTLERCVEVGLDRYSFEDANSAFSGLLSLTRRDPDELAALKSFPAWIELFNRYILERRRDIDSSKKEEGYNAIVAISLFRQSCGGDTRRERRKSAVSPEVFEVLCRSARVYFEEFHLDQDQDQNRKLKKMWAALTSYADAVLFFFFHHHSDNPPPPKLEPEPEREPDDWSVSKEFLSRSSWRAWYECSGRCLDQWNRSRNRNRNLPAPPFILLTYLVQVAARYGDDQQHAELFLEIFHSWRSAILYYDGLRSSSSNTEEEISAVVTNHRSSFEKRRQRLVYDLDQLRAWHGFKFDPELIQALTTTRTIRRTV